MRSMPLPPKTKKIKPFKMSFIDFRILLITFKIAQAKKVKKSGSVGKHYKFDIFRKSTFAEKNNELISYVSAKQKTEDAPFFLEVQGAGKFIFQEKPDEIILSQMSNVNCPAIVFPYIRETIADITRRAGFPPVHLNPVNFITLLPPPQHPSRLSPASTKLESLPKTNKP